MKILLTGSEGKISTNVIRPALKGHEIIPFDLVLGDDMLDVDCVKKKGVGVDLIIHTAGIAGPTKASDAKLYEKINLQGGKNIIDLGIKTIFLSSMSRYGVDSWMRHRYEKGAIVGDDVAVPKYLPIDIHHPSILEYDNLAEYKGKYYGESKAKIEEYAKTKGIHFISLRMSGFLPNLNKKTKRWEKLRRSAKEGEAICRKMHVYSIAGATTPEIIQKHILWAIKHKDCAARNTCVPGKDLEDICRVYFPTLKPSNQIFV